MTLALGTRLGPYEVTGTLGVGGMGEVYRARDTRLKRDVALKILPESFATDPDRLARFQREAEVLASLNHPSIAAIYGLEEQPGAAGLHAPDVGAGFSRPISALVLELVEGETLADRINRGRIPVEEALQIARQIAEALEAAHERCIIHRDLKPANIKLRPDGTVKVLDFGLAKPAPHAQRGEPDVQTALTHSPTVSVAATHAGVILGTAPYMAPEQTKGHPADQRSDMWAFGCVLYEMLTGSRAFDSNDLTEIMGGVVRLDPDWRALPHDLPPGVDALLRTCLIKDHRKRRIDAIAALFVLDHVGNLAAPMPETWAARRHRVVMMAAIVLFAIAVTASFVWWMARPDPLRVVRSHVVTQGTSVLSVSGIDRDFAVTADGTYIAYRGDGQLLVRALDELAPRVLADNVAPRSVFVSPDGRSIGFFDGNTPLKRVAITGGPISTITPVDGAGARGATWGADGSIVFATNATVTGLQRVSSGGGDHEVLTTPDRERGEADHVWPEFLPGGTAVLFTILPSEGGIDDADVAVLDLDTGTYRVVMEGGTFGHWIPTGHLVYGAGGVLRAVPFDLRRLEVTGEPVTVLEDVLVSPAGAFDVAFSSTGTLAYVARGNAVGATRSLVWIDRAGREERIPSPLRAYQYPRISPDGTRVALDIRDQENDIWLWHFAERTLTRLTLNRGDDQYPVWTPDGRRLLFASTNRLAWQQADGAGGVEALADASFPAPNSVTPDGRYLIFRDARQSHDLLAIPLQPPGAPRPILESQSGERNGEVSPDGRWLAYESDESGRTEIHVRPFPAITGGRWQVSSEGGRMPLWSRDGREFFYVGADGLLMGVRLQVRDTWRAAPPTRILPARFYDSGAAAGRTYDIAPDGQRFLVIKQGGGDNAPQNIVVVQNWFEELKRLVAVN